MSEKKSKKQQAEKTTGGHAGAERKPEERKQVRDEVEALTRRLEEAEAKAAENLDGWQRARAEFLNYKKRVERDRESDYTSMKGDILIKVLPVLDDLLRALENRPENDSWADGMELIARKFQSILEAEGVKRIEAVGQPFDPNYHEAISHEPNSEVESGHVIDVVQQGYMLGERVLRPAKVRVAQ